MVILRARTTFQRFVESEASGGVVLMASAALGLVVANSAFAGNYTELLHTKVGGLHVLHWINDGLMALFFLLVGLEIKREILAGELDSWPRRALPFMAALGGMIVPAVIFFAINWRTPDTWRGWAIPTATDIAFALGVLSLFGSRIPNSLKVFLTSLAIMDDLGAILIIALFYAADLSTSALGVAALLTAALFALNWFGIMRLAPYLLLGVLLWGCMLFSGIHATLAGVVLAMTIPVGSSADENRDNGAGSPLHHLEDALGPWVAFLVLPVFGFANAGVSLAGASLDTLLAPLSLGIAAGLFFGKQIGIMISVFIASRTGLADLPAGASWREIYGVALLCGIGFTMSLFIGLLAFADAEHEAMTKLAVLAGSLLSAFAGAAILIRRKAAA
ncbi:MAG: Na+/H+ antiporter NhaA [Methyloceanibacter sp.]|jgi:NhaA family Na+:H+ antiporter|nr:Na+/H+ antiporter NhaA [Methyloceanibacter sp.]